MRLETHPITARSFEKDYFIDSDAFERAYKSSFSGFSDWSEALHAKEWLVFPENIGPHLCIDETCLSTGEVYTIVPNKDAHGRKGCIVAIAKGTKARLSSKLLKESPKTFADKGETPKDKDGNPIRVNAAYHLEKLENGETRAEILARSKYLLMMSPNKWTDAQKERAAILLREYPEIEKAFSLSHSLRMIFSQRCSKEEGRKSLKIMHSHTLLQVLPYYSLN